MIPRGSSFNNTSDQSVEWVNSSYSCSNGTGAWREGVRSSITVPGADVDVGGYSGFDIPDFHRKKNSGVLLPFTPWKQWEIKGKGVPSDFYYSICHDIAPSTYNHEAIGHGVSSAFPITLSDLENIASRYDTGAYVQGAAARIYGKAFDAGTFLGELGETVKMLKGFTKRFVQNSLSGNLSDIWLEARYGWRPLYYDMLQIQEAISRINDQRNRYVERFGHDYTETEVSVKQVDPFGPAIPADVTITDEVSVGVRGTVAADASIPVVSTNGFVTAWELLTLSFVIDWVIQVGAWIESMSLLYVATKVEAAGGKHVEVTRSYQGSCYVAATDHGRTVDHEISGSYTGKLTLRSPTSVPAYPQTRFNIQGLKIVDLLALMMQRIR